MKEGGEGRGGSDIPYFVCGTATNQSFVSLSLEFLARIVRILTHYFENLTLLSVGHASFQSFHCCMQGAEVSSLFFDFGRHSFLPEHDPA